MTLKPLNEPERTELVQVLKTRFDQNPNRHPGILWPEVLARLNLDPLKLASLAGMENTGGEPDVIGKDPQSGEILFCDCSIESPKGRRSLCYDQIALDARKENKPVGSALGMAEDLGITILNEEETRFLQTLGIFDTKTSSWIRTPDKVRKLGGAFFMDRRYDTVFLYHNGADSYYGSRGFRGILKV